MKCLPIEMRVPETNQRAVDKLEEAGFRASVDDDQKNALFRRMN